MLIASGLIVNLFDEARAADISIENMPTTMSGTTTLFVSITVPDGERLPIDSTEVILERNPGSGTVKTPTTNPVLVGRASCETPIVGCPTVSDLTVSTGTAIRAISFDNFYRNFVGSGSVLGSGYEAACAPCTITKEGGYGYLTGAGYGYGGIQADPADEPGGTGYGYNDGGADLIVRFSVTINANALSAGDHWMTFLVHTGSGTLGILSSPATAFTVGGATGGGGGGGGAPPTDDDGTGGDGTAPTLNVDAVQIATPEGAVAAFRAIVTADAGTEVTISFPDSDFLDDIVFIPDSDLTNAEIDIIHYPADNPPDGTGPAPDGVSVAGFIQITISAGGESHTVIISVTIPAEDAGDPDKAILFKWVDDAWAPQAHMDLTENPDGSFSGSGESTCCSDYMVGFDEEDPTVTLTVPEGELSGSQTFTAEADDNVEVSKVEFFVGDQKIGEDSEAPYEVTFDVGGFENGEQTVRAVATDFVGNTGEASETTTFQTDDEPDDGDGNGVDVDGDFPWGIVLIVLVVLAVIGAAAYFVTKKK